MQYTPDQRNELATSIITQLADLIEGCDRSNLPFVNHSEHGGVTAGRFGHYGGKLGPYFTFNSDWISTSEVSIIAKKFPRIIHGICFDFAGADRAREYDEDRIFDPSIYITIRENEISKEIFPL